MNNDIVIVDYSTSSVHIYRDVECNDIDTFIEDKGFNFDEIYYMIGNNIQVYDNN